MKWEFLSSNLGRYVFLTSALTLLPQLASAGAWLRDEGQTQVIFSSSYTGARQRFDKKAKPVPVGFFAKKNLQILTEHGFSSHITMIAGITALHQQASNTGQRSTVAEGSVLAGIRLRLWSQAETILSAQLTGEATGERRFGLLNRRFDPPASTDLRLLLGHSFTTGGMSGFIDLQTAYRWRGGSHPDETHIDATLGLRPLAKTLLLFQSFNSFSLGPERRTGLGPARQHKLQTSIVYDLTDRLSLQAGGFASLAGKESLKERGLLVAVWWKL
jgi:protein XagA